MVDTESIIHHVEVENQFVDLVHFLPSLRAESIQSKDRVKYLALFPVRLRLSQILCLILVQSGIQEKVRNFIVGAQVRSDGRLALRGYNGNDFRVQFTAVCLLHFLHVRYNYNKH